MGATVDEEGKTNTPNRSRMDTRRVSNPKSVPQSSGTIRSNPLIGIIRSPPLFASWVHLVAIVSSRRIGAVGRSLRQLFPAKGRELLLNGRCERPRRELLRDIGVR